ncbi:ABC transporter substrate-binding protein [Nonomuraea recticatena]|uniref:ABC transporter substrate-binding protein n=1 Tax=Nonomuraea recticatena TaxID=46178 RepID=A0ABN3RTE7_9ACTN
MRSLLVPPVILSLIALTGCSAMPGAADAGAGRIDLVMLQPPRSGLNPLSDDAFKLSRWSTAETLVNLDAAGDPQPALATGWSQSDRLTWTFTIRRDVRFHDGTPLTAERAARSLRAAAAAAPKPRILDGVELTVTAKDDKVLVATATPDPLVPHRLSSPQLAILAEKAYQGRTVNPVGTGTGAFVLTKVDGTSGATLERNERYWGPKAKAAGIEVRFVPDGTARAAALRTGEADIVEAIPVSQAALLDSQTISEVPMPRTNTLYLNTAKGAFKDPGLRAAARAAIDSKALVTGVYEGRADVAAGLLGPALPWSARRPARPATVEPGPANGTKITLATFTDRAELPEVAAVLRQQLERAGFEVELVVREYAHIEADALEGAFDAFILSRATVLDSGDPVAYMVSDFSCEGSFNIAQLCDERVDAALEEAARTPAGEERRRAILAAEAAILNTGAAIPMLHERVLQGDAKGVTGSVKDPRERLLITADTHAR